MKEGKEKGGKREREIEQKHGGLYFYTARAKIRDYTVLYMEEQYV